MRRVVRLSSRTPRSRSRAASVRTTEGRDVSRVAAAAVRLPFSTIRTNVLIAWNLFTVRIITPYYEVVQYQTPHLFQRQRMQDCAAVNVREWSLTHERGCLGRERPDPR